MINTYETIFICPGDLSQEKIDAVIEKTKAVISRSDGKIVVSEAWGRRKLAYAIDGFRDGFYVYILFSSSDKTPAILDRHYQITDTILRGLTVKVDPRHLEKIRPAVRAASSAPVATGQEEPAHANPVGSTQQETGKTA